MVSDDARLIDIYNKIDTVFKIRRDMAQLKNGEFDDDELKGWDE